MSKGTTSRRLRFEIFRYNPEDETSVPHTDEFELDETPFMTLYIALNQIREKQDPGLQFDFACRSAICGSCGMMVNGRPALACRTLTADLAGAFGPQLLQGPHPPHVALAPGADPLDRPAGFGLDLAVELVAGEVFLLPGLVAPGLEGLEPALLAAHLTAGRIASAREAAARAAQDQGLGVNGPLLVARVAAAAGDVEGRRRAAEAAVALDDGSAVAQHELGQVRTAEGRLGEARDEPAAEALAELALALGSTSSRLSRPAGPGP